MKVKIIKQVRERAIERLRPYARGKTVRASRNKEHRSRKPVYCLGHDVFPTVSPGSDPFQAHFSFRGTLASNTGKQKIWKGTLLSLSLSLQW